MPERLSQNNTATKTSLCLGTVCCISNVLGFIYGLLAKNFDVYF